MGTRDSTNEMYMVRKKRLEGHSRNRGKDTAPGLGQKGDTFFRHPPQTQQTQENYCGEAEILGGEEARRERKKPNSSFKVVFNPEKEKKGKS